jgi:hypothetical protein
LRVTAPEEELGLARLHRRHVAAVDHRRDAGQRVDQAVTACHIDAERPAEHDRLVTRPVQGLDDVATDDSGASRYRDAHPQNLAERLN